MTRPEPAERLDPRARTLWRLTDLLVALPLLAGAAGVGWVLQRLGVAFPLPFLPFVVTLALAVAWVTVGPGLVWRSWRYEVGQDEVDLQHGLLTVTRTLIPVARIQHVETRRGFLQRQLGMASVVMYTAAGASEIPALADSVADAVRDRIARLANTDDEL